MEGFIFSLKNSRLVTKDGIIKKDILIKGKRIAKVGGRFRNVPTIDAKGLLVLPGLIDVHVHLRDLGTSHKEDFYTGTCAALAGGVTTVLDMPNNAPSIDSIKMLEEKKKVANSKVVCDYGLYFGANTNNFEDVKKVDGVAGLKIYAAHTTGNLLVTNPVHLECHFSAFDKTKPICVHTGGDPSSVLELARRFGNKIHICHVSSAKELGIIRKARQDGVDVSCEVTPHHMFLEKKDEKRLRAFAKMKPPLIDRNTRMKLWENLENVDIFATDHAPHTKKEKRQEFEKAPAGVPGLETMLPLLLDAVNRKMMTIEQLVRMTSYVPAQRFWVKNKGQIWKGYDADFVLVDPKKEYVISEDKLFTKCGWTPFEGRRICGKIEKVFVQGVEAYDGENILVKKGFGRDLYA